MKGKKLKDFPGYAIGRDGSFWSCRWSIYRHQVPVKWQRKKPTVDYQGYEIAVFQVAGKTTSKRLHRVVWEAFNGPIPVGMTINHEDGNKRNNSLSNLTLMTQADNMKHAWKTGLIKNIKRGESAGNVKLQESEVLAIRALYETGKYSQPKLAKQFHTCASTICDIVNRTTWKHV
jgi:hypothetical protein